MVKFPAYKTAAAAASFGCLNCAAKKMDPKSVKDSGYPPRRGQYVLRCGACGMSKWFDLEAA